MQLGPFQHVPCSPIDGDHDGRRFRAWPIGDTLGEGPLWHPERKELYWFDIPNAAMRRLEPVSGRVETLALPQPASAAAWIDSASILIAVRDGLWRLDLDTLKLSEHAPLPCEAADMRANDGRCDPWGRFWIGTMADPVRDGAGALYRLDGDRLTTLKPVVTVPNAIAFAPSLRRGYFADSPRRTIAALTFEPETGALVSERIFASIPAPAVPDGAVVDATGRLWNAEWDGGRVIGYAESGALSQVISMPVSRPTCPAFGGPELGTLYVTSARYGLSPNELAREPLAGALFAFDQIAQGQPEQRFRA